MAAAFPDVGIGLLGVAFAFGLTVLTMAYCDRTYLRLPSESGGLIRAVGGGAVSCQTTATVHRGPGARWYASRRILYLIASGARRFDSRRALPERLGVHSPGGYSLGAAL